MAKYSLRIKQIFGLFFYAICAFISIYFILSSPHTLERLAFGMVTGLGGLVILIYIDIELLKQTIKEIKTSPKEQVKKISKSEFKIIERQIAFIKWFIMVAFVIIGIIVTIGTIR